ncbi:MAG: hypothetical protein VX546_13935 [Myxococcota bacterium]|nr:hypothetical protein [Myxococcota bacterium]
MKQLLENLPARLGLQGNGWDARTTARLIGAMLLLYGLFFALYYPDVVINDDESEFLRQTQLLLQGTSSVVQVDPFTGAEVEVVPGTYPLGTPLLSAPFVAVAGWRGAFLPACLSLIAAVLLTAAWIRREGRSPVFALILLGFPPALVMGRVAMSDVPSAAVVALGLWLFWRGIEGKPGWWLASGFVAGASLVFRVTNPLLFVPLYAGTVLRREWKCWALIVGGLVGIAMRPLTMQFYFGSALFERSMYHFSPETLFERIPLYLFGLLLLVPGGLCFAFLYRGRRRPEVLATLGLFVAFFLFQKYSTVETGLPKRIVLGLRYFIPLLPLLAFAMAESVPRLWQRWITPRGPSAVRWASGAVAAWLVIVAVATVSVHPFFNAWSATQAQIRDEIERVVPDDAVLLTNWSGTKKFVRQLERRYVVVKVTKFPTERVAGLFERHPEVYLVLLDRTDSAWWRRRGEWIAAFLEEIGVRDAPETDLRPTSTDRLRIWRIEGPPRGEASL